MPQSGRPPTKIAQHDKVCLTTEGAKAVYESLNQDQTVSPIHFDKDLPKLHSIREAAYAKLENILEEEGRRRRCFCLAPQIWIKIHPTGVTEGVKEY